MRATVNDKEVFLKEGIALAVLSYHTPMYVQYILGALQLWPKSLVIFDRTLLLDISLFEYAVSQMLSGWLLLPSQVRHTSTDTLLLPLPHYARTGRW